MVKCHKCRRMSLLILRKFPHIIIYILWSKNHACDWWIFFSKMVFSTFKPIYLKYLKSLQYRWKSELSISNEIWQHVFRYEVGSYIFIFSVTCLVYIFFFSYVVIIHLLKRGEGVGIYYKLIPYWTEPTRTKIWITTQHRTEIQNQIRNNTCRII